jgi:hypothetical protein
LLLIGGNTLPVFGIWPTPTPPPPPTPKPPKLVTDLVAGQHYDAGDVTIWVAEDGKLNVEVEAFGWTLGETNLYVGPQPPKKAAPGKFPYKNEDHFEIDLGGFEPTCDTPIYVALHAVVSQGSMQEETAWADKYGIPFGKGWAMYIEFPGALCPLE